jgi:hypothetical protein
MEGNGRQMQSMSPIPRIDPTMQPQRHGTEWDVFDPMQASIVAQRMTDHRREADEARLADSVGSHRSIRTVLGAVLIGVGARIAGSLEEPALRRA